LFESPSIILSYQKELIVDGISPIELRGPWKLMLLGDGSPTRHLRLLTGKEVRIKLISMSTDDLGLYHSPPEVRELSKPLVRRQVWIQCNNQTLAWAESWWNKDEADQSLTFKNQPIWQSLTSERLELFREVDGLSLVDAKWLKDEFNKTGPFWSRHYRFFRNKKAFTVIREVFSPYLEQWLGKPLIEK